MKCRLIIELHIDVVYPIPTQRYDTLPLMEYRDFAEPIYVPVPKLVED